MVQFDLKFRVAARWVLSLCLVGVVGSVWAQDAKTTLVLPPAPLLPQQFGGWQMDGAATTGSDPAQVDGANAASLKEFGIDRFAVANYAADPKAKAHVGGVVEVKALQFGDATGAAAAFSFYRKPELRGLTSGQKLGAGAAVSADQAIFWSGDTLVIATAKQGHAALVADLKELEVALPKIGGPKGAPPLLPALVPTKGLEAGSLRYALGPVSYAAEGGVLPTEILGWNKSGEVVTARYVSNGGSLKGGSGEGVLTLLLYPTPQIAGDRGRAIQGSINDDRVKYGTAKYGTVTLRREGPMVMLATGGLSVAQEKDLVEGIHLPVQLTWDKKMPLEFHAEVQKTYSLLTSIMVFCGVGSLAAIILGLFLGVGRATIRVWMGKPAASEPEFLRIDLRGQSAPIHLEGPSAGTQG
jgi:hypothetical protein